MKLLNAPYVTAPNGEILRRRSHYRTPSTHALIGRINPEFAALEAGRAQREALYRKAARIEDSVETSADSDGHLWQALDWYPNLRTAETDLRARKASDRRRGATVAPWLDLQLAEVFG